MQPTDPDLHEATVLTLDRVRLTIDTKSLIRSCVTQTWRIYECICLHMLISSQQSTIFLVYRFATISVSLQLHMMSWFCLISSHVSRRKYFIKHQILSLSFSGRCLLCWSPFLRPTDASASFPAVPGTILVPPEFPSPIVRTSPLHTYNHILCAHLTMFVVVS